MRSFTICSLTKYYFGVQMKENEMGRGWGKWYIQGARYI
jgi:hypothetical protein